VLCCAMLCCYAMPCHAMLCHAMPCHAMPCHAMPCYAMSCCAMLWQAAHEQTTWEARGCVVHDVNGAFDTFYARWFAQSEVRTRAITTTSAATPASTTPPHQPPPAPAAAATTPSGGQVGEAAARGGGEAVGGGGRARQGASPDPNVPRVVRVTTVGYRPPPRGRRGCGAWEARCADCAGAAHTTPHTHDSPPRTTPRRCTGNVVTGAPSGRTRARACGPGGTRSGHSIA
jgi:hypothetical protein